MEITRHYIPPKGRVPEESLLESQTKIMKSQGQKLQVLNLLIIYNLYLH